MAIIILIVAVEEEMVLDEFGRERMRGGEFHVVMCSTHLCQRERMRGGGGVGRCAKKRISRTAVDVEGPA